jgi:hypothetical protein
MKAWYTNEAGCRYNKLTEEDDMFWKLEDDTKENRETVKENGLKYVHLFEEKTDEYDQTYYVYVTSQIMR